MGKIIAWFDGKKTNILAVLGILYGVIGWIIGYLTPTQALEIIWAGFTTLAMRAGIASIKK